MFHYISRRLLQAIPTVFGITLITYLVMLAAPGDPITLLTFDPSTTAEDARILRRQLGLDKPPLTQYVYWLIGNDWTEIDVDGDGAGDVRGTRRGLLRGDLGQSIQQRRPVWDLLVERLPVTLQLTGSALVVGYAIGLLFGVVAAMFHGSLIDQFIRVLSVIGIAVPSFWLGLLLLLVFSVELRWLPLGGSRPISGGGAMDTLRHMILPVSVLSFGTISTVSRFIRAEILEVKEQDYIRTAYGKGLPTRLVVVRHVMRNALIPVATLLGAALGSLLAGAVVIEQVFSWPGMGRLLVNAVIQRDFPLVMGSVVFNSILYIVGVLSSDILYGVLDPRVRYSD